MQYEASPSSYRYQPANPSYNVRSPTYNNNASLNMGDIRAVLPVVDLPPYELPPDYVSPSERRHHPDYNSDIRKFQNRTVHLRRSKPSDQLGFNLRGGTEYKCGIFISMVTPRTDAHRVGLQEGDQILFVNGESFLHIEHSEAVKALKRYADIEMVVKYFPYAYDKTFSKCK